MSDAPRKLGDTPSNRCLEYRDTPALFLRFESPREQIALPYASLVQLTLKLDSTALELAFVTHRVTVSGHSLEVLYAAVAEGQARVVRTIAMEFTVGEWPPPYQAIVRSIRIDSLEEAERSGR
jgi:hypothetical protein